MVDPEIDAIQKIIEAIEPLDASSRGRVLTYVSERYDLKLRSSKSERVIADPPKQASQDFQKDIRTLKEEKQPETAVEMAVLVAYYLTEYSPIDDRRSSISTQDLKPYFTQANYPHPASFKDVLPNAKKSGYVDSVSKGQYKLNSVGYNLVAHSLPRSK